MPRVFQALQSSQDTSTWARYSQSWQVRGHYKGWGVFCVPGMTASSWNVAAVGCLLSPSPILPCLPEHTHILEAHRQQPGDPPPSHVALPLDALGTKRATGTIKFIDTSLARRL